MLKIAYSDIYKYHLPEGHRFPMIKYELLPEQLLYEGTISEDNFFHPDQLTHSQLLKVHSEEYLDKLNHLTLEKKEIRKIGFPVTQALIERGKFISCGTLQCAYYALTHGASMNIAGGTHHAYPDHGEGFCVFNDMALATRILLDKEAVSKVMFVDLDVHQGNGNAFIFTKDERVFTFSMHGAKNYPVRKEISDLDLGVPDRIEDKAYLKLLDSHLERTIDMVQPDLIFFQSGVDILDTDKLGRLSVSKAGCRTRDRMVMDLCKNKNIPLVITMGWWVFRSDNGHHRCPC